MSEFSGKNVKELREAYASIYSQTDENEVISEEKIFEAFVEEFANEFISYLREEGLLKESACLQEGWFDASLKQVAKGAWNRFIRPVFKQTTGLGAQPTTRTGRAVRAVQQATVLPTAVANPGGSRDIAVGAITGAVKGAFQGGSEAQAERQKKTTDGVPYIDPSDRNSSEKPKEKPLVLPAGFERGPNGEVRRKK
jgi:hypothetical protein